MSTAVRAFWLAIFSIVSLCGTLAVLAWDEHGRVDHDLLLVGAFFFSAPVICLSGLLLIGSLMAMRGKRWLVMPGEQIPRPIAGRCNQCTEPFTADDLHCPGCGRSLSRRWISPRMMSPNAKEREQSETERIRLELRLRRHPLAIASARTLVQLSEPPPPEDAAEQCLSDGKLVQRLYRAAARRLHPDHNDGEHLDHWFELQTAVKTLQAFHDLASPCAS